MAVLHTASTNKNICCHGSVVTISARLRPNQFLADTDGEPKSYAHINRNNILTQRSSAVHLTNTSTFDNRFH